MGDQDNNNESFIEIRDTQQSQYTFHYQDLSHVRQNSFNQSSFNGIAITFKNLSYKIKNKTISVVDNVSGVFPGAKISAILGSSGAGKTTLLNLISCRIEKNKHYEITGELLVNGHTYDYEQFNHFAAYVMQNDILLETQSPREAITFVAQMKFKDPKQARQRVNHTIKALQLDKCMNTVIGGLLRKGISGGERKRTSIAVELVSDPDCLILDEPTSGLDSYTAFHIINELKKLAHQQKKTIIFTIHQPSNDIYKEFDHIIIMSRGRFVFQGTKVEAELYFSEIHFQCPNNTNPPDHFISVTHKDQIQDYLFQQYDKLIQPEVDKLILYQPITLCHNKKDQNSNARKVFILLKRNYQNYIRNEFLLAARLIITLFLGLTFVYIYWKIGENNGLPQEQFYEIGSVFFLTTTCLFCNALGILLVFDQEREVFIREEASKLYGLLPYFLSKQFLELPDNIILTFIQCSIAYWMMGYNDYEWWYFLQSCAIFSTLAMCGNSIGMMCGCILKQRTLALSVTPLILIPFVMYGGYLANQKNYYKWIRWFQYINPLKYAFEAEVTNETNQRFYLEDPLQKYHLHLGIWQCIGYTFLCFIMYRVIALLLLSRLRCKLQ